ncbi:20101_t:CDS:2, partial [Racocetra fulgida]
TNLDRETEKETNEALVTFVDRGTSLSIQQQRKRLPIYKSQLRLIVSSATLDAEAFYEFFNTNITNDSTKDNVSIISLEGKMFPVDIHYLSTPCSEYVEASIQTVFDIHVQDAMKLIPLSEKFQKGQQ